MDLVLPGYEADRRFGNVVYLREAGEVDEMDCTEVVVVGQYRTSTQDDVLRFFFEKARDLRDVSVGEFPDGDGDSNDHCVVLERDLSRCFLQLPEGIRRDLYERDEVCVDFIRSHCGAPPSIGEIAGERYLYVRKGLLPSGLIQENDREGTINHWGWYSFALVDEEVVTAGYGEEFSLNLLLPNGFLPRRKRVDHALREHVVRSRLLTITDGGYEMRNVSPVLDSLYSGLASPEHVCGLVDITQRIFLGFVKDTLEALHCAERVDPLEDGDVDLDSDRNGGSAGPC